MRFDPPASWTVAGSVNGMRSSFTGHVVPVPGGARLQLCMEIETRGLLRAALPLLRRRMPRNLARDIALIKARLEGQADPRPPRPGRPARGSDAALGAVKAIHTLAWFSIEACMVYVLYAGFARRSDRSAGIAAGVVAAESLIFAGNGFRCPLTQVAERLGAQHGSVTDIYLSKWFARYLPAIHVRHPGWAATAMTLGSAGDNPRLRDRLVHLLARRFAPSAAQGAQPILFAATSPDVQGGDFIGPGGLFGVRGAPGRVRAGDRARDEDLSRRLWQVSEHLTGLRYALLDSQ